MTTLLGVDADESEVLAPESLSDLLGALQTSRYVTGYSHTFYRYPARFAPEFARAAIERFTDPGDLVLDPFAGGGTALVEALAAGRRAIGFDLNPLAQMVSLVKTTPLSKRDHEALRDWAAIRHPVPETLDDDPRTRNLPQNVLRLIQPYLAAAQALRPARRQRFARCVLLRIGQWMLESRDSLPDGDEFGEKLLALVGEMLSGLGSLIEAASAHGTTPSMMRRARRIGITTTAKQYWVPAVRRAGVPRLVLTSPPYPGVHVLYHRWQVAGRRETPAPYWIANLNDGHGGSHYTFGSRTPLGLANYFSTLRKVFAAVRQVIDEETTVAQIVAFSDPNSQLSAYLAAMEDAGFTPSAPPELLHGDDLWRKVPHRRWYIRVQDRPETSEAGKELLLLHRLRSSADGLRTSIQAPNNWNDDAGEPVGITTDLF